MNMELVTKTNDNSIFLVSNNPNSFESFFIAIPKLPATPKTLLIDIVFNYTSLRNNIILSELNRQAVLNHYSNLKPDTCLIVPIFEGNYLYNISTTNNYRDLATKLSAIINMSFEILNRQKIEVNPKVVIKSSDNSDFPFLKWFHESFPNNVELEVVVNEDQKNNTGFNFVVGLDEKGNPVVSDDSNDRPNIINIEKEKIINPYVKERSEDPPVNIVPEMEEVPTDTNSGYANFVLLGALAFLCVVFVTFLVTK